MRQAILATAVLLSACGSQAIPAEQETVPLERPTRERHDPSVPRRVFSIDSITAACTGGALIVQASASTNSGGWSQPTLRRLGFQGGTVTYEVVAIGPTGPAVSMMMQIAMIKHEDPEIAGVTAVRILAESNEMSAPASGCPKGN